MKHPTSSDPQSLFDVWNLYQLEIREKEAKQKASVTLSLVKSALVRYTLPGWGLEPSDHKRLTAWESYSGFTFMKGIKLPQISQALEIQQQVFDQQLVPLDVQRNYRAALKRFLQWCQEQHWWQSQNQIICSNSEEHSEVTRKREQVKPQRPKYSLGAVEGDFVSQRLQDELEEFSSFRRNKEVKQSTLDKDLRQIRLILGWLHRFKGIPLAELSLQQMVSFINLDSLDPEQIQMAEATAYKDLELANEYIQWLDAVRESGSGASRKEKSLYTSLDVLRIFLVVAQFIYRDHPYSTPELIAVNRHQDIPVVQLLRQKFSETQATINNRHSEQQISEELPNWTDFLAIVEQMRHRCTVGVVHAFPLTKHDTNPSLYRELAKIAYNYQCFILAAFFCYFPPVRQQVWRNLQLHPSMIDSDKTDKSEQSESSGTISRHEKDWSLFLYKIPSYRSPILDIPNINYPDGRNFYQYINEWLFDFEYRTQEGIKRINGLRQVFNPQHKYFFTQQNGKRFIYATNFSKLIQTVSSKSSNELYTPELVRRMFIAYISEMDNAAQSKDLAALIEHLTKTHSGRHPTKKRNRNYDVWADPLTIALGLKITAEMAQTFVLRQD
jgi:hypothetical protein